jgi:TonB family protein
MSLLKALTLTSLLAVAATSSSLLAQGQTVYTSRDGVTLPSPVKQVKPEYTKSGLQQRIQGSVLLSSVILADGTVSDVRVDRSLDEASGLDQAAIDAMKQWAFKPGTKDGKPVAVRIQCEITFTLK